MTVRDFGEVIMWSVFRIEVFFGKRLYLFILYSNYNLITVFYFQGSDWFSAYLEPIILQEISKRIKLRKTVNSCKIFR